MAKVNIVNVVVLDNPSPFLNPFQFEITFEALEDLSEGSYLPVLCYARFDISFFFLSFQQSVVQYCWHSSQLILQL